MHVDRYIKLSSSSYICKPNNIYTATHIVRQSLGKLFKYLFMFYIMRCTFLHANRSMFVADDVRVFFLHFPSSYVSYILCLTWNVRVKWISFKVCWWTNSLNSKSINSNYNQCTPFLLYVLNRCICNVKKNYLRQKYDFTFSTCISL